ncbi:MAG: DUF1080 domain-containing protein [Chitinophagaceae bacterium]|nr:DUF1080 domain-containing protein [Chitinophagaceae bacterium]
MKPGHLILLVIIIMGFFSCRDKAPQNAQDTQSAQNNVLSSEEKKQGWELLFDGQTINGWRFFKGGEIAGWKVADGILCNSGVGSDHGGDIVTKEKYKDFELSLEWKIDSMSNSGVFYHVQELDSVHAIYESGPEYQLADDMNDPDPNTLSTQYTGANYGMNRPVGAEVKPLSEWNKTRILVKGPHVEHWLNGVKVVEYELWSEDWKRRKGLGKWKDYPYYGIGEEGYIGLQDHGGLTCFRNIKVRRL